jgi:hypothetical protein
MCTLKGMQPTNLLNRSSRPGCAGSNGGSSVGSGQLKPVSRAGRRYRHTVVVEAPAASAISL